MEVPDTAGLLDGDQGTRGTPGGSLDQSGDMEILWEDFILETGPPSSK